MTDAQNRNKPAKPLADTDQSSSQQGEKNRGSSTSTGSGSPVSTGRENLSERGTGQTRLEQSQMQPGGRMNPGSPQRSSTVNPHRSDEARAGSQSSDDDSDIAMDQDVDRTQGADESDIDSRDSNASQRGQSRSTTSSKSSSACKDDDSSCGCGE